ncbi:hypothetical protein FCT18_07990 [Lysinibacillus sphaericus]|uniref:Uncharacterized protein n=1 Tax=Lysinibacillus sphaericus TaxID=1421 RepID=A0A2S0JYZ6_LYSSH|nr:hypothetical protein [Lysinibacillus sphaericus]AVK96363.1 hypothetical protein LS41612_08920 [Lysinibacillus sphaericus]MED4545414.1 hypothetical protein [Lysinibacillus sphaericus]TKI19607.1 hypothetical protein FCT18_07990 [Lysinibacillus sphaericus]SUV17850.1 Uncharacterised protein [Lysinibacillus sphaericus]GEC82104.1 hypothetical protein LSP03_18470 [Lysinibacillus sphaericus]
MATAKYSRYEYNATTSISRANIGDMSGAQEAFINYWKGKVSKAALTTTLGGLATTALEKVFNKTSYTAIPSYLVSALTSVNEWEKNEVLRVAEEGDSQINKLLRIFNDNKAYISISFRVNYLAFKNLATGNTDFTIVQGNIIPIRVLTSSGGSIPL